MVDKKEKEYCGWFNGASRSEGSGHHAREMRSSTARLAGLEQFD
jgi:hypothetical protein